MFADPDAYLPVVHTAHAEFALALLSASPCPATHVQSDINVLPVTVVFLFKGHVWHASVCELEIPPAEYVPRTHNVHTKLTPPKPGLHRHVDTPSRGSTEN